LLLNNWIGEFYYLLVEMRIAPILGAGLEIRARLSPD
jgi:hypothetical protein